MSEILIRRAKMSDVPAISRIETDSFASPQSANALVKDVTSGDDIYFIVAESEGRVSGFAEMKIVAGEAQIYDIAVSPDARGCGIGEALMRSLIEAAEESGCRQVNLEVRAGNTEAISLYNKLGFREVGRRRNYYGGKEDAILMDLDIAKIEIEVTI